jgi:hypothetical protein
LLIDVMIEKEMLRWTMETEMEMEKRDERDRR